MCWKNRGAKLSSPEEPGMPPNCAHCGLLGPTQQAGRTRRRKEGAGRRVPAAPPQGSQQLGAAGALAPRARLRAGAGPGGRPVSGCSGNGDVCGVGGACTQVAYFRK